MPDILKVALGAVVGGTASELTGGKFKNGAGTAAFAAIVGLAAKSGGSVNKSQGGGTSSQCVEGSICQKMEGAGYDQMSNEEKLKFGQELIDSATDEVYKDFNGLTRPKGLKITAKLGIPKSTDGDGRIFGEYVDDTQINIYFEGQNDARLTTTVFHELLHLDEAFVTTFGNHTLWKLREAVTHFGHDPWVTKVDSQYYQYKYLSSRGFTNAQMAGEGVYKPKLSDAAWR